ncbi:MAG: MerR family transcriptional regulator [Polyangiaceae bacterium]
MQSRLPPKLYFRIGEVASLVGVEPHVLRYWEREFRTIRPTKSAKGQRVYSRRDVENLMRVRELLYQEGFTIAGAKKKLERNALRRAESEQESGAVVQVQNERGTEDAKEAEKQATRDAALAASRDASQKIRETLTEMKAEVEAFLAELG